ncbi:MAG: hypothetical protein WCX61_05805 [Candidatus Peribacteraceae bacterium]|jgi:hypothetical protein
MNSLTNEPTSIPDTLDSLESIVQDQAEEPDSSKLPPQSREFPAEQEAKKLLALIPQIDPRLRCRRNPSHNMTEGGMGYLTFDVSCVIGNRHLWVCTINILTCSRRDGTIDLDLGLTEVTQEAVEARIRVGLQRLHTRSQTETLVGTNGSQEIS